MSQSKHKVTALDILQEVMLEGFPTVAQVLSGEFVPPADEVTVIVHRKGQWIAAGPFLTKDVEWNKLLPTDRIYRNP